jgi:hypothetical protein
MKCSAIIALATGAYATQDTTPPVITLSLAKDQTIQPPNEVDHHDPYVAMTLPAPLKGIKNPYRKATELHHTKHAADWNVAAKLPQQEHVGSPAVDPNSDNLNGAGVKCEVDSDATICPLPTCTAYDHHDLDTECTMHTVAVNVNGEEIPKNIATTVPFTRNLRAEFLLRYDATDNSGNKAETVSFTMIFHDLTPPVIVTEFGTTIKAGDDFTVRPAATKQSGDVLREEAESCSREPTGAVADRVDPCTWTLAKGETATDDYDGPVTDDIVRKLVYTEDSTDHTDTFAIDTQKLGTWVVTVDAQDKAGIFGKDEQDNAISQVTTVHISDNTKPTITSDDWDLNKGFNDHKATLECGVDTWVDPGANCWDTRDQWNAETDKYVVNNADVNAVSTVVYHHNKVGTKTNKLTINAAASETTAYTVTYSCQDDTANVADNTVRHLTVQDTKIPHIALVGSDTIENSAGDDTSHAGHNDEHSFEDSTLNIAKLRDGSTCSDECDNAPTTVATLHYGAGCEGALVGTTNAGDGDNLANFPEYTAGDYSVKYTCSDGNAGDTRVALTNFVCRNIQNVDHTLPVITILGSNTMVLEATHTGNYVDDGAVCSDQVDGVISQNVEVSGDVVNLSKAGAYDIAYNCKDSAGNSAPTAHRSVTVKQTTCPTCTLNDADKGTIAGQPLLHEASFPYTDAGVVCQDVIDGVLTEPSSYDITNPVEVDTTGLYVVTYRAKNSVPLWNDDVSCRGTATNYFRTVQVKDTLKPIIRIKYDGTEVARSAVLDTGIPDSKTGVRAANPAADGLALMGEQQGSAPNAWVLAAAASAVTGLALLGYSSSRVAVTSVPV